MRFRVLKTPQAFFIKLLPDVLLGAPIDWIKGRGHKLSLPETKVSEALSFKTKLIL